MIKPIVERSKEIIFSNEGNYGSVNANDNGALSIGCVQWHAGRAKGLLRDILKLDMKSAETYLPDYLIKEIQSNCSWSNRVVNSTEKAAISKLLTTAAGKKAQDNLADKDVTAYVNHIISMGYTDEETIIFLADIENQGGAGTSTRIGMNALKEYGTSVTLEQVLHVACTDVVMKNYQKRRIRVYEKLTGKEKLEIDGKFGPLTIKALQKFLNTQI